MAASLEELLLDQSQRALDRQERTVAEVRQRTGTLMAAAALVGGLVAGMTPRQSAAHDELPTAQLRLADVLWRARIRNHWRVEAMHWLFALAALALGVAVALAGVAMAVS